VQLGRGTFANARAAEVRLVALKAAMETPGAAEAMAHDGVVPETLVMLVEAYRASKEPAR
jgi:hypothetical protein